MQACVVEADVKKGGCLKLEGLPFGFEDHVEVIIVKKQMKPLIANILCVIR